MRASMKMPDANSLRLFDSCMTFGNLVHSGVPEPITAENVNQLLDRYCIAEALVHECHARFIQPSSHGNLRLLEAVKTNPRLHAEWVIEPPKETGSERAEKLVNEMLDSGVRAARWPVAAKGVPIIPWLWEYLATVLESHRVPCFLDFGSLSTAGAATDLDLMSIKNVADAHPNLPLILSNVVGGLGIHYAILPLMRRTKNVYLDTTGLLDYWRTAAEDVGAERVLFATGAPFNDPAIYVSNVQYEYKLSEEQKRLICGDNLRRLLRSVR